MRPGRATLRTLLWCSVRTSWRRDNDETVLRLHRQGLQGSLSTEDNDESL